MQKVKIIYHSGDFSRKGMGRSETLLSLIRNQQALGSTPRAGSSKNNKGSIGNESGASYHRWSGKLRI